MPTLTALASRTVIKIKPFSAQNKKKRRSYVMSASFIETNRNWFLRYDLYLDIIEEDTVLAGTNAYKIIVISEELDLRR